MRNLFVLLFMLTACRAEPILFSGNGQGKVLTTSGSTDGLGDYKRLLDRAKEICSMEEKRVAVIDYGAAYNQVQTYHLYFNCLP